MSVEKMDFESKDWAPWLENCIKGLFDEDVKCIGMVAITLRRYDDIRRANAVRGKRQIKR